jgi:anti-sigma regulatory factor (Ser/Thr protein kinase)
MEREREGALDQRPTTSAAPGVRHQVLVCQEPADWLPGVTAFAEYAIGRGEPVSVGVSSAAAGALREALGGESLVEFFDMEQLGRNPGRIITVMLDFAARHAGRELRFVSEPVRAGRPAAESAEAARHETLVALALADLSATVLCLYDGQELDAATLACAEQTHPLLLVGGRSRPSARYAGPGILPAGCDRPLPPPPAGTALLTYRTDLRAVRQQVTNCAIEAGLPDWRAADLVLAASEVAANTLRHTRGGGILQVWYTADELVCQITDSGHIGDPLAGRCRPASDSSGQGLWVVNQVCDLVELRSGPGGTTIRMHVSR